MIEHCRVDCFHTFHETQPKLPLKREFDAFIEIDGLGRAAFGNQEVVVPVTENERIGQMMRLFNDLDRRLTATLLPISITEM